MLFGGFCGWIGVAVVCCVWVVLDCLLGGLICGGYVWWLLLCWVLFCAVVGLLISLVWAWLGLIWCSRSVWIWFGLGWLFAYFDFELLVISVWLTIAGGLGDCLLTTVCCLVCFYYDSVNSVVIDVSYL